MDYEDTSEQLVSGNKSHFMLHSNVFNNRRDRIKWLHNFRQKQGSFTYLGFPLFVRRRRIFYISDLVHKDLCRITGWNTCHVQNLDPDEAGVVDLSQVGEKPMCIIVTLCRLILAENMNIF